MKEEETVHLEKAGIESMPSCFASDHSNHIAIATLGKNPKTTQLLPN